MRCTAPAAFRVAPNRSARLGGRQGRLGRVRKSLLARVGNGRQNVDGELVGAPIVHRDELDARVHEGRHEGRACLAAFRAPWRIGLLCAIKNALDAGRRHFDLKLRCDHFADLPQRLSVLAERPHSGNSGLLIGFWH
jgi:hypothetical protein